MTADRDCRRYSAELDERGEVSAETELHAAGCASCSRVAHDQRRLLDALQNTGRGQPPPGDWQARVVARTDRPPARPLRASRVVAVALPLVLAAAAVLLVRLPRSPRGDGIVTLTTSVVPRANSGYRGSGVPGDALEVRATVGSRRAELRLYRNNRELVLRCAGPPACVRDKETLSLRYPTTARGQYRAALIVDATPTRTASDWTALAPAGSLDADVEQLTAGGADVRVAAPIEIY